MTLSSHSVLNAALDCVVGALETVREPTGITFHRVPASARAQMSDLVLDLMSAVPSGIRIEALTDSAVIELDVELTHAEFRGMASVGSVFDLVVDGAMRDPVRTFEETIVTFDPVTGDAQTDRAGTATMRFELGEATHERGVEVWLPVAAAMKLTDVRIADGARLKPAPPSGPLWVHHGSSISQCSEADRPTGAWPTIVARKAGRSLMNLAIGGQCQLDQFMARTIRDLPATAISLELGINIVGLDSMRERVLISAFNSFLDTVRDGHPGTPILIITPILSPPIEDRPGPLFVGSDHRFYAVDRPSNLAAGALSLNRLRDLLHEQVEVRRLSGDTMLHVIHGLDLFGPADVDDLPDGVHPTSDGYRRLAERFFSLAFGDEGAVRATA